jgi:protein TonB
MNEKLLRFGVIFFAVSLHIAAILFLVFETQRAAGEMEESARLMKVTDLAEIRPPPPSPDPEIPQVEEIAEIMIETDTPPVQEVVAAGTLYVQQYVPQPQEVYLPMHQVSIPPVFDESALVADLVYPPIALRSGIEGRVILELFVDSTGTVQRVIILREEPEGRGFGEAAVRVFMGRRGTPAFANGIAVSSRYRYPVTFRLR